MKTRDYADMADLILRVIERHKATPDPNPVVLLTLEMLEQEFRSAPQIIPTDDA